jgi:hypothetical protein
MRCPTCGIAFRHQFNLDCGTHVDYQCSCGQLLQWDQPVRAIAPRAFVIGQPEPCEHPELKNPDALFPSGCAGTKGIV